MHRTQRHAPRLYRCKIVKRYPGGVHTSTYVGPLSGIPAGWSLVMRRAVARKPA